jgi:LAO/AO transport system kinase
MSNQKKPAWTPHNAGDEFASNVIPGVEGRHDGLEGKDTAVSSSSPPHRQQFTVDEYVQGVLAGNRTMLARAITLVESNATRHFETAQAVIQTLLAHSGNALRVGITGVPGAGKSTLIETLGLLLTQQEHKVAVLAVDPTSSVTKGSILGDKTRMEKLSRTENAFIRPSPTGGILGGVARKTRETMLLCEAAGFDIILVETVGTGQSEITVRSMVDFFLLMLVPGAGDELQGIKKGVVELADAIFINKADGKNKIAANAARAEYNRALHYLTPATQGWLTRAHIGSALSGEGVAQLWNVVKQFQNTTTESGGFAKRRRDQLREWLHMLIEEQLKVHFYGLTAVQANLPSLELGVMEGTLSATTAAHQLLQHFKQGK